MVVSEPHITDTEKRDLVARVLRTPSFSSSRALQAFLQFITYHSISGDLNAIKEHRIGSEVLGRKHDYDPAADNIVRVRAHELRQKLTKYFEGEGADEPIVITIPKGSYVPSFVPRRSARIPSELASLAVAPAPERSGVPPWIPWILASVLLAVLVIRPLIPPGQFSASPSPALAVPMRDLWGQFFRDKNRELTVVSADSGFALWQDITGRNIELGDYITRKFVQQERGQSQLAEVASRLCTSPADLTTALELSNVGMAFGGRVRHRYARDLAAGELRTSNVVLMGSRRSNPWVGLFESRMNFVLAQESVPGSPRFHNKAPKPGEPVDVAIPSRFDSAGSEQRQMPSYAVIALQPNLSGTGFVLILEGLSMEGSAAAGDVVTNPDKLAHLLRRLGREPGTTVRPFEALMKLTSIPGGFAYPEVIAVRSPSL